MPAVCRTGQLRCRPRLQGAASPPGLLMSARPLAYMPRQAGVWGSCGGHWLRQYMSGGERRTDGMPASKPARMNQAKPPSSTAGAPAIMLLDVFSSKQARIFGSSARCRRGCRSSPHALHGLGLFQRITPRYTDPAFSYPDRHALPCCEAALISSHPRSHLYHGPLQAPGSRRPFRSSEKREVLHFGQGTWALF